jgi:hypothetical protein
LEYDVTALPVPTDVLVYTEQEWENLLSAETRMARMLRQGAIWVYLRDNKEEGGDR